MGKFTRKFVSKSRTCGTCDACCFVVSIEELGHKPAYSKCPHQIRPKNGLGGCGIYPERPGVCRRFQCSWLTGTGRTSDRPDKLGAYMTFMDTPFGPIGRLYETRAGTLESDAVIDFVRRSRIIDKCIVIGVTQHGSVIIGGPEPHVSRYRQSLRASRAQGHETGFLDV